MHDVSSEQVCYKHQLQPHALNLIVKCKNTWCTDAHRDNFENRRLFYKNNDSNKWFNTRCGLKEKNDGQCRVHSGSW